jgi:hypothetical protein
MQGDGDGGNGIRALSPLTWPKRYATGLCVSACPLPEALA